MVLLNGLSSVGDGQAYHPETEVWIIFWPPQAVPATQDKDYEMVAITPLLSRRSHLLLRRTSL